MSIDNILNNLNKVKSTGNGTWIACCPAHNDKSPSMTIRLCDDGKILLHCFSGCDIDSILGALGIKLEELFPDAPFEPSKPIHRSFPAHDVLKAVYFEVQLTALAAANIANGIPMSGKDRARLILAAQRLNEALYLAGVK